MKELTYHLPPLGRIKTTLYKEAAELYDFLESCNEIERLKQLDHLGIIRFAIEGAHHSRWEYIILTMSLIDRCREVKSIHLSSEVTFSNEFRISSGFELLKIWSMLLNIGHIQWTFTAENALLLEVWQNRDVRKDFINLIEDEDVQVWAKSILQKTDIYKFYQILALIRISQIGERLAQFPLWQTALKMYMLGESNNQKVENLRQLYRSLRKISYLILDSHYVPALASVDVGQILTDPESLEQALQDLKEESGTKSVLHALETHLYEAIYLGPQTLRVIAEREKSLRQSIRKSLREKGVLETLEALAKGEIQRHIEPQRLHSLCRLHFQSSYPFNEMLLDKINPRIERNKWEKVCKLRNSFLVVWQLPYGNEWIVEAFLSDIGFAPKVLAGIISRLSELYLTMQKQWENILDIQLLQELLYGKLASEVTVSVLKCVFKEPVYWEYTPSLLKSELHAILGPRRKIRQLVEKTMKEGKSSLPAYKLNELQSLRECLLGKPQRFAIVTLSNLIGYSANGEQLGEIDGLVIETVHDNLRITLIEAKGGLTATRSKIKHQVDELVEKLGLRQGWVRKTPSFGRTARTRFGVVLLQYQE